MENENSPWIFLSEEKMRFIFPIIQFLLITVPCLSQNKVFLAQYRQSLAPGADKTGYLIFDNQHSLYYSNRADKRTTELINESEYEYTVIVRDGEGLSYYTRFADRFMVSRSYILGDEFVVLSEKDVVLHWQTGNQLRKIGRFLCRDATIYFRGRQWRVWFTEEIPVPAGPWKLHGLTGLIVEAEDETKSFYFYLEQISQTGSVEMIKPPTKGLKVEGWEKYCEIYKERSERIKRYLQSYEGLSASISFDDLIEKID